MKRILHIANTDKMIHDFRLELLLELQSMGYEIHICARSIHSRFPKSFEEMGFIFHNAPIKRGFHPVNAIKSSIFVKKIIKKYNFSLIHTHTPTGGMIGRLASRLAKHPVVFHTTAGLYFHENMRPIKYHFFASIERFLTAKTQILFSPNYDDIETCKELKIQPIDKIVYCGPAGVDMANYPIVNRDELQLQLKEELNIPQENKIVGLVARVEFEKGYREFVTIIDQLNKKGNKITGVCIGAGRDQEKLEDFIKTNELSNTLFLGYRKDIPRLIPAFDILLFPSYREGLPIVTLESMAARTPVIAYDIRGCRESIKDNETGILIPFKNDDMLLAETQKLLTDPEKIKLMGANGRNRVKTHFTRQLHVERQIPYYINYLKTPS